MVFQENLKPCLEDDIAITHLTYGKDLKWDGELMDFLFFWGVESGWKVLGMEASMMGSLLMNHFGSTKPHSFEDEILYLWGVTGRERHGSLATKQH